MLLSTKTEISDGFLSLLAQQLGFLFISLLKMTFKILLLFKTQLVGLEALQFFKHQQIHGWQEFFDNMSKSGHRRKLEFKIVLVVVSINTNIKLVEKRIQLACRHSQSRLLLGLNKVVYSSKYIETFRYPSNSNKLGRFKKVLRAIQLWRSVPLLTGVFSLSLLPFSHQYFETRFLFSMWIISNYSISTRCGTIDTALQVLTQLQ